MTGTGGDAHLLHLPEIGIFGTTHFPMLDLNAIQIANLLQHYLHEKGLDRRDPPHQGPQARRAAARMASERP